MAYWLMKSEPEEFGIEDLESRPDKREPWDGVRNYQARNMMRDEMKPGDLAFFYHSNCETPGIVGIVKIATEGYPDPTAFDADDDHYDPKSDPANPRWYLVDVEFVRKLQRAITLSELKAERALEQMPLTRRGNRLSVMPVTKKEWEHILAMERREGNRGQP
jgi:predicted RNA-binding protein with PUA-like domain